MKYCFVILHYMSETDTYECIDSIINLYKEKDYHIVIVDNASSNGSGERILRNYSGNQQITVILEKVNLGFARGNNVGYLYAKMNLYPEFIIVINNDVLFIQSDFLDKIEKIYQENQYHALGPDILDLTRTKHQNPMRDKALSRKEIEKIVEGKNVYVNAQVKGVTSKIYMALYLFWNRNTFRKTFVDFGREQDQCVLQGSCIIFSKLYIDKHDRAFFDGTFLYFEEDILKYLMDRNNEKMMYSHKLKIIHKEDRATDMVVKEDKEKNIFKAKHMIASGNKLLLLMKENGIKD